VPRIRTACIVPAAFRRMRKQILDLRQIEWVKWGGFSQVECDSKGFFVNVTVTSWRHVCAHAKIDQDEAPER